MPDDSWSGDAAVARAWRILRRWQAPVAVAAVVLVLLGASWASREFHVVERDELVLPGEAWTERGAFTYAVPVERDSPAYGNGTVLGMGLPGYFSTVSPRVLVDFEWTLEAPGARVAGNASLRAVVSAVAPGGAAYWSIGRELARAPIAQNASAGARLSGVLDVVALAEEADAAVLSLGGRPSALRWSVVAVVDYAAERDDRSLRNASEFALPVHHDAPLYALPPADALASRRTYGEPSVLVREHRAGLDGVLADPAAPAAALVGAAALGLLAAARRADPARRGGAVGAFERELERHAEWVTRVRGPLREPEGKPMVDLESLQDLVLVAAESGARVLLDPARRVFHVPTAGAWYRYAAHEPPPPEGIALVVARGAVTRAVVRGRARPNTFIGAPRLARIVVLDLTPTLDAPAVRRQLVDFLAAYARGARADGFVLGLSGGVDSAVCAALAVEAVGPERVLGLLLPHRESSPEDAAHARLVADAFRIPHESVDITGVVEAAASACATHRPEGMAFSNLKPRSRMLVLYAHANALNRLVVGTGNKSELLTGYFTKYGDGGADVYPIGDLYKTQVWALARELGVPREVAEKPPTAGLYAGQTDEAELGIRYADLDRVLGGFEAGHAPETVARAAGVPIETVRAVEARVIASEHKRTSLVVPKVGFRTPGLDWRQPRQRAPTPAREVS